MSEPGKPGTAGRIGELVQDGAAIAGAGLIVFGVELVSRPGAFVLAGCFLLAGSWLSARNGG